MGDNKRPQILLIVIRSSECSIVFLIIASQLCSRGWKVAVHTLGILRDAEFIIVRPWKCCVSGLAIGIYCPKIILVSNAQPGQRINKFPQIRTVSKVGIV